MADEPQSNPFGSKGIDWRAVFPFTHIFRAFRVAVHPSKLVLGLLALLSLYAGGRIMDAAWPSRHRALPEEIERFAKASEDNSLTFGDDIKTGHDKVREGYANLLISEKLLTDAKVAKEDSESFNRLSQVKSQFMAEWNDEMRAAEDARKAAREAADKEGDETKKAQARRDADAAFLKARATADENADQKFAMLKRMVPHGIFEAFLEYEVAQVNGVAKSVYDNNWLAAGGVKDHVQNFFGVGPVWLWKYHLVYAILFTLLFLLVWAVFGGAISRIAAVHVARDEKISVRQALRFSLNKLLSFVFAPVIPLVIIFVIGLIIAAGGLLLYLKVIGPIVVGAVYFLALIASVVITLVLFGTIGGFGLMYPTIAVEGSDSFDAISRSFSYVFARPWRMLFYTVVAILYGALTYLFVRFFIWIVLVVSHQFTAMFLTTEGTGYWFNRMFPEPMPFWAFKLPYDINYAGLAWSEDIAASLIAFWVYLTIGLLGAYAISYYLSVSTIIYGLMRKEVDATELEDVYVEENEDDLMEFATPAGPTPATAGAAVSPATTTEVLPASTDISPSAEIPPSTEPLPPPPPM